MIKISLCDGLCDRHFLLVFFSNNLFVFSARREFLFFYAGLEVRKILKTLLPFQKFGFSDNRTSRGMSSPLCPRDARRPVGARRHLRNALQVVFLFFFFVANPPPSGGQCGQNNQNPLDPLIQSSGLTPIILLTSRILL